MVAAAIPKKVAEIKDIPVSFSNRGDLGCAEGDKVGGEVSVVFKDED